MAIYKVFNREKDKDVYQVLGKSIPGRGRELLGEFDTEEEALKFSEQKEDVSVVSEPEPEPELESSVVESKMYVSMSEDEHVSEQES